MTSVCSVFSLQVEHRTCAATLPAVRGAARRGEEWKTDRMLANRWEECYDNRISRFISGTGEAERGTGKEVFVCRQNE